MATKPLSPSQKLEQYIVRFPEGMRGYLKEKAAENGRSLNAEIIHRLESTMPSRTLELISSEDALTQDLARLGDDYRLNLENLRDNISSELEQGIRLLSASKNFAVSVRIEVTLETALDMIKRSNSAANEAFETEWP